VDERRFRIIAILLGTIGVVLLILIAVLLFGGGDESEGEATTTTTTAAAEESTTAPTAETTTTAAETTSSTEAPTTTSPTSTTSTTTTTTTTIAPLVLAADGLGGIDFGATPDDAIAYVAGLLGPATEDSGWIDALTSPYGVCPQPEVRGVQWGAFVLLFTRAETDFAPAGSEHLFSYYYTDNIAPAVGLGTEENVFIGSSRAELDAAYGARLEVFEDPFGVVWHVDRDPSRDEALSGFLSGPTGGDVVEAINGGVGCGE